MSPHAFVRGTALTAVLAALALAVACVEGRERADAPAAAVSDTALLDSGAAARGAPASVTGEPAVVNPATPSAPPKAAPTPARDTAPATGDDQPQYRPGTNPWEASRARGASFRGVGQEPGWIIEVFPGRALDAQLDYGERRVVAPWSAPRREGSRVTFRSATAAGDLVLVVTPVPCADAMSGERSTHTVVVRYGASEYQGCGRVLSERWPE